MIATIKFSFLCPYSSEHFDSINSASPRFKQLFLCLNHKLIIPLSLFYKKSVLSLAIVSTRKVTEFEWHVEFDLD